MGESTPDFGKAIGRLALIGQPPTFRSVVQAIEASPQLMRWTAVTAQRNAELLIARLKAIPDVRLSAGWRHYQDTSNNTVRLGVSIPLPIFDQNGGNIIAAQETLAKTVAERSINKLVLISIAGRAHDSINGALAEIKLLRSSVISKARSAAATASGPLRYRRVDAVGEEVGIAVKSSALQAVENRTVVFVRNGDKFEARDVEVGQREMRSACRKSISLKRAYRQIRR